MPVLVRGQVPSATSNVTPISADPFPLRDSQEEGLCRKFALQEGARRLAGSKALDGCFRRRQFGQQTLEAVYYPDRDSAGLRHVQTCGSRWACPVCASLLSELSRRELKAAIDAHELIHGAGSVVMATFTVPHYADMRCAHVLGSQQQWLKKGKAFVRDADGGKVANPLYGGLKRALGHFAAGGAGQRLYRKIGILGTVRNLEVTHRLEEEGGNGWHCHSHAVWFLERPLSEQEFENAHHAARARWESSIRASGLPVKNADALRRHCFALTDDRKYIQDYLTKMCKPSEWHMEHELAKQTVKTGTFGGRTPMQLLKDFTYDGDLEAGTLWAEYAGAYRGSKQLYWSKGLRGRLLGSEREYTDEELLGIGETGELPDWARPPAHEVIEQPTDREWAKVCADGVRGTFLSLVRRAGKSGDRAEFDRFFAPYRAFDRSARPLVTQIVVQDDFWEPGCAGRPDFLADIAPRPVRTVEKVRALLIDDHADERDKPASLSQWGRRALGPDADPLLSDPDALAFWPRLTQEKALEYRQAHAEGLRDGSGGLPFFEQRAGERNKRAAEEQDAALCLSHVWVGAGGMGRMQGRVLSPDGMGEVLSPGAWSRPGDRAVWRVLACAVALSGVDWTEEVSTALDL